MEDTINRFPRQEGEPPFSLKDIKDAIPDSYFEADIPLSLYYFAKDYAIIFGIYFLMYLLDDFVQMMPFIAYPVFWMVQGTMFWALFVIGHDCGHGSFSSSRKLNNLIGHLSHTPILVPFHSWRISHHKHHLNTGNLTHDESFVAVTEDHYDSMKNIGRVIRYYLYPLAGYTMYLIMGMSKPHYYSHFDPKMKLFKNQSLIVESVAWIAVFITGLIYIGRITSLTFVTLYYIVPYLVFVAWIGIVTHFHHTHRDVPWYRGEEWTFMKGAISTIDRSYGIIEPIHHNIGTHIVHHLFMKIPHYKLIEATEYMKPVIGDYYKKATVGVWRNYLDANRYCRFVPNEGSKVYYSSKQ